MTKFQGYVPYYALTRPRRMRINSAILAIIFFFVVILICSMLVFAKRADKCFDKQIFYYVVTMKSKIKIKKENQDKVKSLGGAGEVLFYKENFNLVANAYLSEVNAKDVCGQIKASFENAEVVKVEVKSLSNAVQKKIRQNLSYYKFFQNIDELIHSLEKLTIDYMLCNVSEGKFMSELITKKLELETIVKEFENPNKEKFFEDIKSYANMLILHFDNFFEEFYQSTKKQSFVCGLFVKATLVKVSLFDNL